MKFSIYDGITFTNIYFALIFISILFFLFWKRLELVLALFTVGDILLRAVYLDDSLGIFTGRKGLLYPLSFYITILFVIHLLFRPRNLKPKMIRPQIIYLFGLFIFLVFLTYYFSPKDEYALGWRGLSFRLIPTIIPFASLFFLSTERIRIKRYLNYVFGFSTTVTILYSIAYIVGILDGIPVIDLRNIPVFGLYMGSGSIYAAICSIFCISRLPRAKDLKSKNVYYLLFILSVMIVMLGMSRMIIFASAVALMYVITKIFALRKSTVNLLMIAIFLLGIFFFLPVFENIAILNEISSAFEERLDEAVRSPLEAGGLRFEMYKEGWQRFLESPIIGVGAGNSGILVYSPIDPSLPRLGTTVYRLHMHSFYLEILYEQGLLGTIVILAFLFHVGRIVHFNRRIDRNLADLYEIKIVANSVLLFALIAGITGQATLLFWASALVWVTYVWSRSAEYQVRVPVREPGEVRYTGLVRNSK